MPRFGVMLEMPKEYENFKYFGLGPDVNLPDYKEHTFNGIFETTVDNLKEDYIKPQVVGISTSSSLCIALAH